MSNRALMRSFVITMTTGLSLCTFGIIYTLNTTH